MRDSHPHSQTIPQSLSQNNPLVSVIIPIYNVESYLKECLDSVLGQTLRNIEILCINDGSTDSSAEILVSYAKSDKRIIAIHKINEGVARARNEALAIAKGEFVCFIDPDDFYPSIHTLSLLYTTAKTHHALICGGCFSDYIDKKINTHFDDTLYGYTFTQNGFIEYKDYQFDFGFTRFIYNRALLLGSNIFHPYYTRYEDPVFFVKAMIAARKFYAIAEITYCYRVGHQKSFLAWSERQWSEQNKGLIDVLCLARIHQLERLYALTLTRANIIATNLTDTICAGKGSLAALCMLNAILTAKDDEIYFLQAKDTMCATHFERIHQTLAYFNQLIISPSQLLKLLFKLYRQKLKMYFRIRLFKEYSVIKLFGITFYESFTYSKDSGGGGIV